MTTFTASVAASSDDAQESAGTVLIDGTNLNANSATQISAVRFQNVTIPPGSTINSAYITVSITSTTYDDPAATIRGGAEANPATFTTAANHLTDRFKTSASVAWNDTGLGSGAENTPSLVTLVEEIIAISGWASGNAMAFYFTGSATSSLRFNSYDNGSGIPSITIASTAPTGGSQPRRTIHQFRQRRI